jgi:hypothetical protein
MSPFRVARDPHRASIYRIESHAKDQRRGDPPAPAATQGPPPVATLPLGFTVRRPFGVYRPSQSLAILSPKSQDESVHLAAKKTHRASRRTVFTPALVRIGLKLLGYFYRRAA